MKQLLRRIFILPIRFYQIMISPLFPPKCIYYPSCSTYCIDSIHRHGVFKGLLFGFLRILRCSPFFKGGADNVEDDTTIKKQLAKYNYFRRRFRK